MAIGMQSGCFAACPFTPFDIFHSIAPYRMCVIAQPTTACGERVEMNVLSVLLMTSQEGGDCTWGSVPKGIETPAVQALPG